MAMRLPGKSGQYEVCSIKQAQQLGKSPELHQCSTADESLYHLNSSTCEKNDFTVCQPFMHEAQ